MTTLPVSDAKLTGRLWPVLLAAVVSLFPFTVYSTFLVPIAADAGSPESVLGTLRGLGGICALAVGVLIAPILHRWPHRYATGLGLGALAIACLAGTVATFPALVVFCAGVGAATAILTPTLLGSAVASFDEKQDQGRAATLVTSTQSLAAVMAGPVIGVLALWQGWRGVLWITAGMAILLAGLAFQRDRHADRSAPADPAQYWTGFRHVRRRPDLLATIGIASLRTTSFMGCLAFLAVHYHDRFGIEPFAITAVWTLSGVSFFLGNFVAGKQLSRTDRLRPSAAGLWLGLATLTVVVVFTSPSLVLALVATSALAVSHAVVAAHVTTLIAHHAGALTTFSFSVNAAGMSLGVFVGAILGGVGIALAGSVGIGIALAVPTLIALVLVPLAHRRPEVIAAA